MDALLVVSVAIIFGFIGGQLVQRLKLPAVLGYLLAGLVFGPSLLNIFSLEMIEKFEHFPRFALSLIAFIIGSEMRITELRRMGRGILTVILSESFGAFIMVALGIYLLTKELYLALIFAAMAPASAPAGTVAVLREYRAKGRLTNALYAVVGLDDGLAIMIFAVAVAISKTLFTGQSPSIISFTEGPIFEIAGSILLGFVIGCGTGFLIRKISLRQAILAISIASILLCTGIATHLKLSLILSNLSLGMTFVNLFPYANKKAYEAVEYISLPIYIIFFFLAGSSLQIHLLPSMGLIGLVYIICRSIGLAGGAYIGASASRMDSVIRNYLGLGILSQAGVAIGLSILAASQFTDLGPQGEKVAITLINTIAATTVIFEIIGPIGVKYAISKAGEAGADITEEDLIQTLRTADVMDTKPAAINAGTSLGEIIKIVGDTSSFYYPVIDNTGSVIGTISLDTVRKTFSTQQLNDWLVALDLMEPVLVKTTPDKPLSQTLDTLKQLNTEYAPVVENGTDKLVGVISVPDVHRKLSSIVLEKHRQVFSTQTG